jgi:tyrosine-specific transport protein
MFHGRYTGCSQVGAGILAIPAVTQDAGFAASAVACVGCWAYMVSIRETNDAVLSSPGSWGA